MPTQFPAVRLFAGGDDGYGHAVARPGVNGYHWAINWDCRPPGKAVIAPAPVRVGPPAIETGTSTGTSGTTLTDTSKSWRTNEWEGGKVLATGGSYINITSNTATVLTGASWEGGDPGSPVAYTLYPPPIATAWGTVFEWANSSGHPILCLGSGYPLPAGGSQSLIWRLENDILSCESLQPWGVIPDGCLYRYDVDDPDADEEMGWFCHGLSGTLYLSRRKKDGTIDRSTHDVKADRMAVIGSDFWLSQGYKAGKCTLDANPGKDASYDTWTPVGRPFYPVNKMLELGGGMMAICGDGVYRYNSAPAVSEFQNVTPFVNPHGDNGKAAIVDGRGRLYYDTVDGHILVLSVGFQSNETPLRLEHTIDRDTPWGPITAFAADIDHVYAATAPGFKRTQELGLTVFGYVKATTTYTDETANINAYDWSLSLDLADYDVAGDDYIFIGADEPFWGVYLEMNTARTQGTGKNCVPAFTADYSTSASWVAFDNEKDGTFVGADDGAIVLAMAGYTDVVQASTNAWAKQTVNSVSKYWVRLSVPQNPQDALIHAIYLCPYRPALDPDNAPITGYMEAGLLPCILVGSWEGERLKWHQVWALNCARVDRLIVARSRAAESTSGRTLYALCEDGLRYVPIGPDADPSIALWPKLADYGDSTVAMDEHALAFSGNDFGYPEYVKKVNGKVVFDFNDVQSDDTICVWYWWDDDPQVHRITGLDNFVREGLEGQGRLLYMVVSFEDGSRDAFAPSLASVTIVEDGWSTVEPYYARAEDLSSPLSR